MLGWNLIAMPAVVPIEPSPGADGVVVQTAGSELTRRVPMSLFVIEPACARPRAALCGLEIHLRRKLVPALVGEVDARRATFDDAVTRPSHAPRQESIMAAHGLGKPVLASRVGSGHSGASRKLSIADALGRPSQAPGIGKSFCVVVPGAGTGRTPNSSKRSICWLKSNAPNSGLGGQTTRYVGRRAGIVRAGYAYQESHGQGG